MRVTHFPFLRFWILPVLVLAWGLAASLALAREEVIAAFAGQYAGSAEVVGNGDDARQRDLSVEITLDGDGFMLKWSTITYRDDGSAKERAYEIAFQPAEREGLYTAAMARNVFGHTVPLDPMKGEPYVWAQLAGETLTVYSLFVDETGGYELQQFDRTLADGGLDLVFQSIRNGEIRRRVSAFLARQ